MKEKKMKTWTVTRIVHSSIEIESDVDPAELGDSKMSDLYGEKFDEAEEDGIVDYDSEEDDNDE